MDYNDYELVYLIRENNEEAFEIILKKYEPLIITICKNYKEKNYNKHIELEDLIQECRICLYKATKEYDTNKDIQFFSFLILCLKRKLYSYFNRHPNYDAIELDNDELNIQVPDEYYKTPSYLISEKEMEDLIIKFKNSLDYLDSAIFELRYNMFSYKDIADVLDIDCKQIDNHLIKIRNKLKKYLLNI